MVTREAPGYNLMGILVATMTKTVITMYRHDLLIIWYRVYASKEVTGNVSL